MLSLKHFKKEILVEYKSGVLEYYPDLDLLIVLWKGSLTVDDVHNGGHLFLRIIKKQSSKLLLFDQRDLKGTWVQGNEWLQKFWLPQILKTAVNKIAFIPSPEEFAKYCLLKFIENTEEGDLNVFACLDDALQWLLQEEYDKKIKRNLEKEFIYYEDKIAQLQNLLIEKKIFQEADLTLSDIADMIDISPKKLSYIINTTFKKNFNELINEFRIKEIIANLENDRNDKLTMWGIAHDAGFRSRATFYRAFKKETQLSPSEFISGR